MGITIDWEKAARMFGGKPNATFKDLPSRKDLEKLRLVKTVAAAIEHEMNYLVVGPSGTGKTEFVKAFAKCVSVDGVQPEVVYFSSVLMSVENLKVAFPYKTPTGKQALRYLIDGRLLVDRPIVVVWDEIGQADPEFFSALMEALSEKSFGNVHPKHLITNILLDNPHTAEYGKLNEMEFAQADRFGRIEITAADSPWQYAIAAAYPEIDLGPALSFHHGFRLDTQSRELVSPRVLQQGVIYALLNGIPGEMGLPWIDGVRVKLLDPAGSDVTTGYVDGMAEALGVPSPKHFDNKIERALDLIVRDGISVYIEGAPGCGKTSKVKDYLAKTYPDIQRPYLSVANSTREDLVIPFPVGDETPEMASLTFGFFAEDGPKVFVADEFTRGITPAVTNAFNEVVQARSTNGVPIPGLLGTVAINNPPTFMGENLDVRPMTIPQASRFALSFRVDHTDTKAFEWLLSAYPSEAGPFLDWFNEAFRNPEQREAVSARTIERLIKHHLAELELEQALARPNGQRVDVPIGELKALLAKMPLARITRLARDVDQFEADLKEMDGNTPLHPEVHLMVFKALSHAELSQLETHRAVVVRLIRWLSSEYVYSLVTIRHEAIQRFWVAAVAEAKADLVK